MATASFVRTLPADNDLRQDGADFRIDKESFQMVPAGGSRPGGITVSGGLVNIQSANEDIVKLAAGPDRAVVPRLSFTQPGTFTLVAGQKAGRTVIVAEDENGKRLDHLAVSVKDEVRVSYNVLRLTDGLNTQAMALTQAEPLLKNVEQLYLSQTNVRLLKKKQAELFIQRNLSDANGVLQLQELFDNKEEIIFKKIMASPFFDADVVCVFAWLIESGNRPFSTTGRKLNARTETALSNLRRGPTIIYINSFTGSDKLPFTIAHEFGHHFGLSHFGLRPSNFLMDAAANGFKMTQSDINNINPTGT